MDHITLMMVSKSSAPKKLEQCTLIRSISGHWLRYLATFSGSQLMERIANTTKGKRGPGIRANHFPNRLEHMGKTSTKSGKGKPAAASKAKSKKGAAKEKKETYVLCPYTDQKVFISKATLSDLKPKKGSKGNNSLSNGKQKRLWMISSSQIRQDHYVDVAQALSIYEQALLPSSGGRSWEVSVKLSEPNARVLFRTWKGQMEVCCVANLENGVENALELANVTF